MLFNCLFDSLSHFEFQHEIEVVKYSHLGGITEKECGLFLDNRVFILVSKQINALLTNQNRDEKVNLRNN